MANHNKIPKHEHIRLPILNLNSIRTKIILTTISILIVSSLIIIIISILQYKEESKDYNIKRLERKERAIRSSIDLVLRRTTYPITTENIPLIFKDEIHHIASVHNMNLEIYDPEGRLLISSFPRFGQDTVVQIIPPAIIDSLAKSPEKRIRLFEKTIKGETISSYTFLTDPKFKPIGILHIPYTSKSDFYQSEMKEFLKRLGTVYVFLIILAIFLAVYLSKFITRSLNTVSEKIRQMDIDGTNHKIRVSRLPDELRSIVDAYNQMVDKLEESRRRLVKVEREAAWKEMAKQIAHEIKNPLTPMKLSIEHFVQTFDPNDPEIDDKLEDFRKIMIEQIDSMSRIAASFSEFTKIAELRLEKADLLETIDNTAGLFPGMVHWTSNRSQIIMKFDKTRIKQALINIIKNAKQAHSDPAKVHVNIIVNAEDETVDIIIEDNGPGIPEHILPNIFDPKFTTKSSGTGLGLAIVKRIVEAHGGWVKAENRKKGGARFIIHLPRKQ